MAMDLNNVLEIGTQLFKKQLDNDQDGQVEGTEIATALVSLLSNNQGQLDLGSLVNRMQGGELISIATSWLGDGPNAAIRPEQLAQLFNSEQITAFAQKLGISPDKALAGLTAAVPAIVDKSSSSGSLLDMVGGASGVIDLADKLFART
jgi:uncharacterized protein YidB (DUF937 family)